MIPSLPQMHPGPEAERAGGELVSGFLADERIGSSPRNDSDASANLLPHPLSGPFRYPRYPAYKPSDVPWLGEIPAHWEVRRLKFVARFTYGDSLAADAREAGEFPVFGSNGIVGSHRHANTLSPVLIIGRKGSYGKVNYSSESSFAIDTTYFVDSRSSKSDLRWLFYALPLLKLDTMSQDSAVPGLSRELAYERWLPVPPLPEQHAIAAFLDRETAKIDALVAKKERLIELLQEKRAALISRAVTKGLDPNAPMKDSGVAWLGEVPEHWEVLPLKRVSRIRYGLGQPPAEAADGLPLIRATNISSGKITTEGMMIVDPRDVPPTRGAILEAGDIVVVRSGAYTGDSAIIPSVYAGAITGYDMVVSTRSAHAPFIAWQLLSTHVRYLQFEFHRLRAAQPHLNAEELGSTLITVPPEHEQYAIAAHLDRETAKIDALISKVQQAIERLKEYRAGLIAAAVTGKVEVRGN